MIQTCVVHLLRASFRYAAWDTRSKIAAALRPIYTAVSVDAAGEALDEFEDQWGAKYPAIVRLWRDSWEVFTPFLAYPPEIRRVVYTTNMIESINYQLRESDQELRSLPNRESSTQAAVSGNT